MACVSFLVFYFSQEICFPNYYEGALCFCFVEKIMEKVRKPLVGDANVCCHEFKEDDHLDMSTCF